MDFKFDTRAVSTFLSFVREMTSPLIVMISSMT